MRYEKVSGYWFDDVFGVSYSDIVKYNRKEIDKDLDEILVMKTFVTALPVEGQLVEAAVIICTAKKGEIFLAGNVGGNSIRSFGMPIDMDDEDANDQLAGFIRTCFYVTDISQYLRRVLGELVGQNYLFKLELEFVRGYSKDLLSKDIHTVIFGFNEYFMDIVLDALMALEAKDEK